MKKIFNIILTLLIPAMTVNGQTTIESVLENIAVNNKSIIANTKFFDAKKLEYHTGLTPYNPKVDYDYMIGNPSTAGNQTDFSITQAFDFPTVYAKKKQLSNEQISQFEFQKNANRQDVLLTAKLICIELIYRNKIHSELIVRKQNTEKWLADFRKKLDTGEGNIMDVNKAKLQLIEVNAAFQEGASAINQLNQKLTELNGGVPIQFADTTYPSLSAATDFETLEKEIEAKDPVRNYLEQEKIIGSKEVALAKSLALPKIETGYHYQAILGQRFNGLHFGLTVPLWENKNTVKTRQSELIADEANLENHINEHYYKIKQKYERLLSLKITLDEYLTLFTSMNNVKLLDKALSMGQLSTLEYFMEMTYYYNAWTHYLKTEMEYHKVMAELNKYQL